MRDKFAILICKLARFFIRLLGRNGGSTPGKLALKISPTILKRLKYPDIFVVVTGTNGKTSTTNMISNIFSTKYKVVTNNMGDNLIIGLATSLVLHSDFSGNVKAEAVVLEVDEITCAKYLNDFPVSDFIITNFFRDQLDRAGEMATVISKIEHAIEGFKGRLFVCADDPHSNGIAYANKRSFGIAKNEYSIEPEEYSEVSEGKLCPNCHRRLDYEYYHYSHLGNYSCSCGFSRKIPTYEANIHHGLKSFSVNKHPAEGKNAFLGRFSAPGVGLYYMYNQLSAIAVADTYGFSPAEMERVLKNFELGIGRMEVFELENQKTILLNLVKNPAGVNEIIKYISRESLDFSGAKMLFVLGDARVDGTDVSWIWDANVELLKDSHIDTFICAGKRGYDMALRLKYGGIEDEPEVFEHLEDAVEEIKKSGGYIVSTYSNLFEVRKMLL